MKKKKFICKKIIMSLIIKNLLKKVVSMYLYYAMVIKVILMICV